VHARDVRVCDDYAGGGVHVICVQVVKTKEGGGCMLCMRGVYKMGGVGCARA
jgi:hypothetical protein